MKTLPPSSLKLFRNELKMELKQPNITLWVRIWLEGFGGGDGGGGSSFYLLAAKKHITINIISFSPSIPFFFSPIYLVAISTSVKIFHLTIYYTIPFYYSKMFLVLDFGPGLPNVTWLDYNSINFWNIDGLIPCYNLKDTRWWRWKERVCVRAVLPLDGGYLKFFNKEWYCAIKHICHQKFFLKFK